MDKLEKMQANLNKNLPAKKEVKPEMSKDTPEHLKYYLEL